MQAQTVYIHTIKLIGILHEELISETEGGSNTENVKTQKRLKPLCNLHYVSNNTARKERIKSVIYTIRLISIMGIILILLRIFFFFFYCLFAPFAQLRGLRRKRRCPPINNEILLQTATEIAQRIRRKEISCEQVITAYVERCKEVNPLLNAIVEDRFEDAIREAREVDKFLNSTTMTELEIVSQRPLLGLPITIKESIAVQGMSYTVGVKDDSLKATHDADVVAKIRNAGGIILLVSNTPELCLWWHTYNKVTGSTKNPYDVRRTPGGSSGGEAALLAAGASLLSIGSDVGGSIRLPAMFCGVFGHKPTPNWVSIKGHKPHALDKDWPLYFTVGPLVRYATDLPLLLTVVSQSDTARIGFNKQVHLKDMKFFYMDDCGSLVIDSISSDIKYAMQKLIRHVETTFDLKVQKANLNMKFMFEMSSTILCNIENVHTMFNRFDDPKKTKSVCAEILKFLFGMSSLSYPAVLFGIIEKCIRLIPRSFYNKMVEKKTRLKQEFEELLGDNGVLIFPTSLWSAPYPGQIFYNIPNFSFTTVYNVLGLPVTQCPLGFDKRQMPVGVQIVANQGCDHLTIAVAQEIERAFGGWSHLIYE